MIPLLIALLVLDSPQPAATSAHVWKGRAEAFENYLREARVARVEMIGSGVTQPRRAFTEPGGLAASFAWKPLRPGRYYGYLESYKSEIAAYEMDKLLDLNMVPPAVERQVNGDTGAAVLWLENVKPWKEVIALPKPPTWNHQLSRMKMFDNLIGNIDRNQGNLLVDGAWSLFLIDHSRAFVTDEGTPTTLDQVDRRVWERMLALDDASLTSALGRWIDNAQRRAILRRRDRMMQNIAALFAKRGPSIFF